MKVYEKIKQDISKITNTMEMAGYFSGIEVAASMYCVKHCPDEIYEGRMSVTGFDSYLNSEEPTNKPVKTYDLRPCWCGSKEKPIIYSEGIAKVFVNDHNGEETAPAFREFDGYAVECEECGASTSCYITASKAVHEWNRSNLCFKGIK